MLQSVRALKCRLMMILLTAVTWSWLCLQEVVDPLLEKGKAAWNKQQAKLEKRQRAQADWGGGGGRDGGGGGTGPPGRR